MALIPKAATGLTSLAGPTRVPFAAKMAGLPKPPTSFIPKPPSFKPTLPGGASSFTASRKLTPLGKGTLGAAGAGGVGGGATSIIRNRQQSQVAKREIVMTTSAWGVEHGEDIAKAWDKTSGEKQSMTRAAVAGLAMPGLHGAMAGRKGKKLRSFGSELGGATVGAAGGRVAGMAAGALTRSPEAVKAGGVWGSAAGGTVGTALGARHNYRRGYLKGSPKSQDD